MAIRVDLFDVELHKNHTDSPDFLMISLRVASAKKKANTVERIHEGISIILVGGEGEGAKKTHANKKLNPNAHPQRG